jgi:hypothetical protein
MFLSPFMQAMLGNQNPLGGVSQPSQPVDGQEPSTATLAQPTLQQLQQQDYQNAGMQRIGQLGMLLMAAGQRMTPRERATILAQAPQYMGGMQEDVAKAAQARLMGAQSQEAQNELERRQALEGKLGDTEFLKGVGMTPEQARLLGPQGVQAAMQARLSKDPLQEAYLMTQIQKMGAPEWKVTGQNEFGQPQYNLVAPNGQIVTPAGADGQQPGGGVSNVMDQVKGLQGKEVIDKLKESNPGLANQVDAIASGRVPFTTSLMKGPRGEMLEALVNMVDPNYSTTTFDTRKKTATGFASTTPGSAGGQVVFGNTAIKHLLELRKQVDSLNNYQGFPGSYYVNKIGNAGRESSGRSADLSKWKATSQNAADEIAKFYGAGGVEDRAKIHALFDPARGPDELRAVIDEQIKDLFAKTSNLENQYKEGMGPYAGDKKIIYDDTRDELLKTYKKPGAEDLPPGVSIRRVN